VALRLSISRWLMSISGWLLRVPIVGCLSRWRGGCQRALLGRLPLRRGPSPGIGVEFITATLLCLSSGRRL